MMEETDNEAVRQNLVHLIVKEITGRPFCNENVTIGPLMTNYFSFAFFIEIYADGNKQKVFVKIPKEDLRQRTKSIFPISPADRKMAEDEINSLRTLGIQWHADDLGVFWIRLQNIYPIYNAIVTDAVYGTDAFTVFRRLDLRRRLGLYKDRTRLREAMARFGTALGRFHKGSAQKITFRVSKMLPKLERYYLELGSRIRNPLPGNIIQCLNPIADMELEGMEVSTLKGIDIRNILMDGQNKMFLLDPGRMKRNCREADLARFMMTYRIIYWGSWLFLLRLRPDTEAEEAFLNAYYSNTAPQSPKLLSLFLIKEQLKHWHTAIGSLRMLPWPAPVKSFVEATYINPFYMRQLTMELKRVV